MPFSRTAHINSFAGEDRDSAFLPANVASDAINCDYSRGTLRKRDGYVRLHNNRLQSGSVCVSNSASDAAVLIPNIPAYSDAVFSVDAFTVSLVVEVSGITGNTVVCTCRDLLSGWSLDIDRFDGVTTWSASFGCGTGVQTVGGSIDVVEGKPTFIEFGVDKANAKCFLVIDGVAQEDVMDYSFVPSGLQITLGNTLTPTDVTGTIVFDELRIWNKVLSSVEMADSRGRELTQSEIEDSSLVGYWKFSGANEFDKKCVDYSASKNDGLFWPYSSPAMAESLLPGQNKANGAAVFDGMAYSLFAPYASGLSSLWSNNTWAVQFWVRLDRTHASDATILQIGSHSTPLCLVAFDGLTGNIKISMAQNDGAMHTLTASTNMQVGDSVHLSIVVGAYIMSCVYARPGESSVTEIIFLDTYGPGPDVPEIPPSDFGIHLGCRSVGSGARDRFSPVTLDDVRVWDQAIDPAFINIYRNRPLDGLGWTGLVWYAKLDGDTYYRDWAGNSDIEQAAFSVQPFWSRSLIGGVSGDKPNTLAAMCSEGQLSEVLLLTPTDAYSLTDSGANRVCARPHSSSLPLSHCMYRDSVILVGKETEAQKYNGSSQFFRLTPERATIGSATAVAGSGTGLTGVYKYKFQYVSSRDDSRGPLSIDSISTASLSNSDVDVTDIPVSSDPQIDIIRIYRTKADDSVFYRLSDVLNRGATAELLGDNTPDSSLVEEEDRYLGESDPSLFVFSHNDAVFMGNQSEQESRVVWSEYGYYERFYPLNYLHFGRGDGDELTGGISVGQNALITKKHSLWLMLGPPYRAAKIWDGYGCVSSATLSMGKQGVYMLSACGVAVWSEGSNPSLVGGTTQRQIWEDIDASKWAYAVGVYFAPTSEYWVSFDTNSSGRVTMVWNEIKQSWAKLDLGVDAIGVAPKSSGSLALLASINGYCVELRSGENDGANVNLSSNVLSGGVTDSGNQYIDVDTSLYSEGSGLAGLKIDVISASGNVQTKTITYNTTSRIYVDSAFVVAPDDTFSFFIGGISWFWKSGRLVLSESIQEVTIRFLHFLMGAADSTQLVALDTWGDDVSGQQSTFTNAKRFARVPVCNTGHDLRIMLSSDDTPVEVESMSVIFEITDPL